MKKKTLAAVLCAGLVGSTAHAQVAQIPNDDDRRNVVYLTGGIDASLLTLTLGYGRSFALRSISRDLLLYTELSLAALRPDPGDMSARLGARVHLVEWQGFALPVDLSAGVSATSNTAYDAVGLETELTLLPGYYTRRGSIAIEAAWRQTWSTHVTPSETYRDLVYTDAQSGFYALTSHRLRIGARAGLDIHRRVQISVRGGYEHLGALAGLIPPAYATLTLAATF